MPRNHENPISVTFISFVGRNYSRSSTILNFDSSLISREYFESPPGIRNATKNLLKNRDRLRRSSVILVMSPCHILVPLVKLIIGRPVVLDAGWALTDGEFSRGISSARLLKLPLIYLTDLLAFKFSDAILVETSHQISRIHKNFAVKKTKLHISLTGLNENDFIKQTEPSKIIAELSNNHSFKNSKLKVLFRGKINNESGFETILEAVEEKKDDVFYIFVVGSKDVLESVPNNTVVLRDLSVADIKDLYLISDICIGQFSLHPRLNYTIPHKAFEAAYFGKPYVTAETKGISELFSHNDVLFIQDPTSESLSAAIDKLGDVNARTILSINIRDKYLRTSNQKLINKNFEEIVHQIIENQEDKAG